VSSTLRKLALPAAFLVVGLPAGVGVVMAMGGDDPPDQQSAFTVAQGAAPQNVRRAQARWETVTTLSGSGPAEKSFAIDDQAIQWKAEWRCETGALRVTLDRKAVSDRRCPDAGERVSTATGPHTLGVTASAAWRVTVRQQVDTALEEPPLPGMTRDSVLARGRFRPIQKDGEGTVTVHRLPSGRLALRFEDFYTVPSPSLHVWLSRAQDPRSTLAARRAQYVDIGPIRSTLGSYNQMLPAGTDVSADALRSIVVWCDAVTIAFTAASLSSP